jgi:uncharacterized protein (DUF433 family)
MVRKRLAKGMSHAEIADDLDLSTAEVGDVMKKHVQ